MCVKAPALISAAVQLGTHDMLWAVCVWVGGGNLVDFVIFALQMASSNGPFICVIRPPP